MLTDIMETYDYTLYTPFRSTDFPGSIFVLARNNQGRITELTVSDYQESFSIDPAKLFDPKGQAVEFADKLSGSFRFDGNLGLDLVDALVDADLAANYVESVTVRFAEPKLNHRMTLSRLAEARYNLADGVKAALREFRDRGQLDSAFIVLETLQVGGIDLTLTVKQEFRGQVNADEVAKAVKGTATVEQSSDGRFAVHSNQRLLLGYKAIAFPHSILREEVGIQQLDEITAIPAGTMNELKGLGDS